MLHEFESCTEMVRAVVLSCSTGIVAWAEIGTNRCAEASSVGYVEGHSNMRGQAMSSSTPTRSVVERPRTGAPVWRRTRPMCRMHEGNPSRLTRIRKHRRSARRVSTVWNPMIRSGFASAQWLPTAVSIESASALPIVRKFSTTRDTDPPGHHVNSYAKIRLSPRRHCPRHWTRRGWTAL